MELRAVRIYNTLKNKFPQPRCELNFLTPYQLLVAVILSAQCTDKRVNIITKDLFKKYPNVENMAKANINELEDEIRSCGFYHNKAKNIINASKDIVTRFAGKVPNNMENLISLSGVGRKTANVIMAVAFGGDAIAVDTHVFRVSRRLALADANTPEKVELQLQKVIDKNMWSEMHYLMVLFGRYVCKAQRPLCMDCELKDICKYYNDVVKKEIKKKESNKN